MKLRPSFFIIAAPVILALPACADPGEATSQSESDLGVASSVANSYDDEIRQAVMDGSRIYVASDTTGINVVDRATGDVTHVAQPKLAVDNVGWFGNVWSEAIAQDSQWVYAVGKNVTIPSPFKVWRVNKTTRAAEVIVQAEIDPLTRLSVAVAGKEVVFHMAPATKAPRNEKAGLYAVSVSGGPVRFLHKYYGGPVGMVAHGKDLFVLFDRRLEQLDLATGKGGTVFQAEFEDGLTDAQDPVFLSGPDRVLWIDKTRCKVFEFDVATQTTTVLNPSTKEPASDCRLAADSAGVYWGRTRKDAAGQQHLVVTRLGKGGLGTVIFDDLKSNLPQKNMGGSTGPGRLRGLLIDSKNVIAALESDYDPRGFFAVGR